MASDDKPGKKGWRGGRSAGGILLLKPQEKTPRFMKKPDDDGFVAYWGKVAIWTSLFLGLGGVFIWVQSRWPVRPPLLIATVTQYDYPLPPNAWTEEDQALLMGLDGQSIVKCVKLKDGTKEVADCNALWKDVHDEKTAFDKLESQLRAAEAKPGGPNKNVVLMYINMHGAVNGDGEPCLIPPGAKAHDCSTWFSAKKLLQQLFAGGKARKDLKYVVFFDCSRVDADWNLGWLYAGFPQRLGETVKNLSTDNLYVITSSGPGQISWTAPELNGSVFGHYLYRGLQGHADRFGNSDRKVTLGELFRYLSVYISGWVKTHRDDEQTPMLFSKAGDGMDALKNDDFPLVAVPEVKSDEDRIVTTEGTDASVISEKIKANAEEIKKAWTKHKNLRDSHADQRSPLKWQEFQHRLLYLEQLALAGKVGGSKIPDQIQGINDLAAGLANNDLNESWPGYSLPQVKSLLEKLKQQGAAESMPQGGLPAGGDAAAKPQAIPLAAVADKPADKAADKAADKPADKAAGKALDKTAGGPPEKVADKSAGKTVGEAAGKAPADSKANTVAGETKAKENRAEKPSATPGPPPDYLLSAENVCQKWQEFAQPENDVALLKLLPRWPSKWEADLVEIHFLRMLDAYYIAHATASKSDFSELRQAVKVRSLAEEAAFPDDLRAQYVIRRAVDGADQKRRWAEDRLFVGEPAQLKEARDYWSECSGSYSGAIQTAKEVADAFRVRDRLLAELPWYSQWLLHRCQRDEDFKDKPHDKLVVDLRELLNGADAFSKDLDQILQSSGGSSEERIVWPKRLRDSTTKIRELLDELKYQFDQECTPLDQKDEKSDMDVFRRLGIVLSVPLGDADRRQRLCEHYNDILKRRTEEVAAGEILKPGKQPQQTVAAKTPARQQIHPALLILGDSDVKRDDDPAIDLAAQGELVRKKLNEALDQATFTSWRKNSASLDFRAARKDPAAELAARQGYAEGDRKLRSVAALWAGREKPDDYDYDDLAKQLHRADRKNLLFWQAQRTLDDFWGPKPGESQPSYFQIVAKEYLRAAGESPESLDEIDNLKKIGPKGVVALTDIQDILRPAGSDDLPQADLKLEIPPPGLLEPGGEAALYFFDQQKNELKQHDSLDLRDGFSRRPIDKSAPLKTFLAFGKGALAQSFTVTTLYRGHVKTAPIQLIDCYGPETVVTRPKRAPPIVTVSGESGRKTSIIFILDCSGSMKERDVPVGEEGKQDITRIDCARDRLNRILEQLAGKKNQYRIGLLVYGSRYRYGLYDEAKKGYPILERNFQGDWSEVANPSINPDTDVWTLLDLHDFDEDQLAKAKDALNRVSPGGETPLYLSINMAMDMLTNNKEIAVPGPKRVVVITDGFNDQLVEKTTIALNVSDKIAGLHKKGIDIRFDVITFALDDSKFEKEKKAFMPQANNLKAQYDEEKKTLTKLVTEDQRPPGLFLQGSDPTNLLNALRKSVRGTEFVLSNKLGGEKVVLELNDPYEIKNAVLGNSNSYSVSIDEGENAKVSAEFEVEGGEFITLYRETGEAGGNPRLVYRSREDKLPLTALPSDADIIDGRYYVKADPGRRKYKESTFRISVQNVDPALFTRRPKSVWAEIVPDLPNHNEGTAYTYDTASFENGQGFPMLEFHASLWPENANGAKIRLWFKAESTEPDLKLPLTDNRWKANGGYKEFTLDDKGATLKPVVLKWKKIDEVNGTHTSSAIVIEQSVPADVDLHSYKVELKPAENSADSEPDEIHCRSLPSPRPGLDGKLIHRFVFNKELDIQNYQICITAAKRIRDNACHPKELEVHVD